MKRKNKKISITLVHLEIMKIKMISQSSTSSTSSNTTEDNQSSRHSHDNLPVGYTKLPEIERNLYSNIPIEESFDIEDSLKSITQRYYTPYYFIQENNRQEDQCVLFHSNRIALITLAPTHPILKENKLIKKIDFQINDNCNRAKNKVSGKGKRGAQPLQKNSILCHIICEDGSNYSPRSCINGKLVEVNDQLIENPNLLTTSPQEEGFIALVLPNLHKVDEIKNELIKEEDYIKMQSTIS